MITTILVCVFNLQTISQAKFLLTDSQVDRISHVSRDYDSEFQMIILQSTCKNLSGKLPTNAYLTSGAI